MRSLDLISNSDVPKGIDDEKWDSDLESIVTAEDVTTSSIHGRLQELERVCEESYEAVLTTIAVVFVLALNVVEIKLKNATLSNRKTVMKAKLLEILAVRHMMRNLNKAMNHHNEILKTQLTNAQIAFEMLANESSRTVPNLRAGMVAVEKWLEAGKARVEPLERELAIEAWRGQHLLTERL